MENQYEPLETGKVIQVEFSPVGKQLKLSSFFQILLLSASQFAATMKYNLRVSDEIKEQIFEEGLECKVLKYGAKEWQSGKVKLKVIVEFCPDRPEAEIEENEAENYDDNNSEDVENEVSPLDDLRQKFNQEN